MAEKRAYLIYECEHGWCYEPAKVSMVHEPQSKMFAFSRLSQLTWHLLRRDSLKEPTDASN